MIEQFKNFFDAQRGAVITEAALNQFRDLVAGLNNTECEEALFYVAGGWSNDVDAVHHEPWASSFCVELLLDSGVNPNAVDEQGYSLLSKAASFGYTECARLLIERGGNACAITPDGDTMLHLAAYKGRLDCLNLFLSHVTPQVLNHIDEEFNSTAVDAAWHYPECEDLLRNHGGFSAAELNDDDESDSDSDDGMDDINAGVGGVTLDDTDRLGDVPDTDGDMQD